MNKYKDILSIGTTFNKRIYESEYQKIFVDMRDNYSYMNFYVYHEIWKIDFERNVFFKALLKSSMISMLWWFLSDRGAKVSMGHFKEKSNVDSFEHLFQKHFLGTHSC